MKKYRLGYDYLFVSDEPFLHTGAYFGATSINVLFRVFDLEGNEKLFETDELEDQVLHFHNGNQFYLSNLIRSNIDKEKGFVIEPNILLLKESGESGYAFSWEIDYYTKDIIEEDGFTLNPIKISENEFMGIITNNIKLFDIPDNKPAQSTGFFTQEIEVGSSE